MRTSYKVRERLRVLFLDMLVNHEDRVAIDEEIERRKGMNCDSAMEKGLVSDAEFREIVALMLKRKKKPMEIVV